MRAILISRSVRRSETGKLPFTFKETVRG
jgi:hypothetical protein